MAMPTVVKTAVAASRLKSRLRGSASGRALMSVADLPRRLAAKARAPLGSVTLTKPADERL